MTGNKQFDQLNELAKKIGYDRAYDLVGEVVGLKRKGWLLFRESDKSYRKRLVRKIKLNIGLPIIISEIAKEKAG